MKHITFLVTPASNMGSIDNPIRAFQFVNELMRRRGEAPFFKVQIAAKEKDVSLLNGLYTIHANVIFDQIKKTDLIIFPAFDGDFEEGIRMNEDFISWAIKQYNNGSELASLCVGAFILASTGLLTGKSCSTHWRGAESFRRLFPNVDLATEKLMTDEQGIYTSGGAFSSANLILYLIQKYTGREIAIQCSKIFQVDLDRSTQSPFIIFQGQKGHNDEQVRSAQDFIEKNYQERITVNALTAYLSVSRRNLERRFKKATANTIIEYIQRVKIEAVKKQLESGKKTVNELMYEVGYSDTKAFRTVFRKYTGLSPIEYRNKYNEAMIQPN